MLRDEEIDKAIDLLRSVNSELTLINVLRLSAVMDDYGERVVIYSDLPRLCERIQEKINYYSTNDA